MDTNTTFSLATLVTVLSGILAYVVKLNHKRIRSTCCNRVCVTSIDVEETTPPREEIKVEVN